MLESLWYMCCRSFEQRGRVCHEHTFEWTLCLCCHTTKYCFLSHNYSSLIHPSLFLFLLLSLFRLMFVMFAILVCCSTFWKIFFSIRFVWQQLLHRRLHFSLFVCLEFLSDSPKRIAMLSAAVYFHPLYLFLTWSFSLVSVSQRSMSIQFLFRSFSRLPSLSIPSF